MHAIGDQAIDHLLDLYARVAATNPPRERRFRVIHTQVIRGPVTVLGGRIIFDKVTDVTPRIIFDKVTD